MTPSHQGVDRPDPRPVEAGGPVLKCRPQTGDGLAVQPDRTNQLGIPHRSIHSATERTANPLVEGQYEAALRSIEEAGAETGETDPPEQGLSSHRLVANLVWQAGDCLDDSAVDKRQ